MERKVYVWSHATEAFVRNVDKEAVNKTKPSYASVQKSGMFNKMYNYRYISPNRFLMWGYPWSPPGGMTDFIMKSVQLDCIVDKNGNNDFIVGRLSVPAGTKAFFGAVALLLDIIGACFLADGLSQGGEPLILALGFALVLLPPIIALILMRHCASEGKASLLSTMNRICENACEERDA